MAWIFPAIIVLGANAWTTNDNTLYSSALGLSNLTKLRKRPLVILSGVIGTALSVWLYENFTNWLLILNAIDRPEVRIQWENREVSGMIYNRVNE